MILCYHHIVEVDPPDPLGVYRFRSQVETRRFEQQMEVLARRYSIVPLHTLLAKLTSGILRAGLAAVTFDDGYADNYEVGFPTLRRLGIPATIYLTTGYIDSGMPFWMDRLAWLLSRHAGEVLSVSPELGGDNIDLSSRERVVEIHFKLRERLRTLDRVGRERFLNAVSPESPPPSVGRPLTWEGASEMQRQGVSFGAHSQWHSSLVALANPVLKNEIEASRDRIIARLGSRPVTFAYPYGHVDERVSRAVEVAGFLGAVTVRPELCSGASPRYLLPRVQVGNWDRDTFTKTLDTLGNKPNHIGSLLKCVLPPSVWPAGRRIRNLMRRRHSR